MSEPYEGPDNGHVDILVHFSELKGQPLEIRNVDPDRFGIFDAHECVNILAQDEGLTPANPFNICYLNITTGALLPLKEDKDVINMWECVGVSKYCHLYVSRPMLLLEGPKNTVVTHNEAEGDAGCEGEGVTKSPVTHTDVAEDTVVTKEYCCEGEGVSKNPVTESVNVEPVVEVNQQSDVAEDTENEDEVYVSEEDVNYECGDEDQGSTEDDEYTHDEDDNSDNSEEFEESVDVIGEEHSDEDWAEVYVERGKVGKKFEYQSDGSIQLQVGQLFVNVDQFRKVLYDFSIQEGFDLVRVKNERRRVTCKCLAEGCKWRIHASPTPDGVTFKIKTLRGDHDCIRSRKNRNATSTWIAKRLENLLMADPNISYAAMKEELLSKYGIEPANLMQLYRAKRKVLQTSKEVHSSSYNLLPPWAVLVRQTNRGSIVKMEVDRSVGVNPTFKRLFVCLDALKKGFVKGCRPWFGVDGCHLKGPYGGVLLSAVGIDGNKGMFPIAIGVVEVECKDSWKFFLTLLANALATESGWKDDKVTIMSDMQKGLQQAVAEIFPDAKHRFCCNHLLNHFKQRFKSLLLTTHFWSCAMAYNEGDFDRAMERLRKESSEAAEWMVEADHPKSMWARHTYQYFCKSDHVTNNICEAFNGWLGDDRRSTILSLCESLHCRLMKMLHKRFEKACDDRNIHTSEVGPL